MFRLAAFVLMWAILGGTAIAEVTQQAAKAWIQFGAGKWATELNDGANNIEMGTAAWRASIKKNATIGRFEASDRKGIEIAGWIPDKKVLQVNGYNSKGGYWDLTYEKLTAKGGEGPIHGSFLGKQFKGHFAATVLNQDTWEWKITGQADGEEVVWSCKYSRKKD